MGLDCFWFWVFAFGVGVEGFGVKGKGLRVGVNGKEGGKGLGVRGKV